MPVHFSAISCVICIFRPVVVTGTSTCHFTLSQILNKSTKISKNQNKPTQGPSHNYMLENAILLKSGQACLKYYYCTVYLHKVLELVCRYFK